MKYSVKSYPFTYLEAELDPGEKITAEAGAFIFGKGEYEIKTETKGVLKGVLRALFGGEKIFFNTFIAKTKTVLGFAPPVPGKITELNLSNEEWYLNDSAYLAHCGDIEVGIKFMGLKGLLARRNLFWIKVSGTGKVWINAYGDLIEFDVPAGERMIIDNSQLLAIPANADFKIRTFGGLKSFVFGGEGLVIELEGPAKVLIQTRSLDQLLAIISSYLSRRTGAKVEVSYEGVLDIFKGLRVKKR